jgi:hypothetical protein
MVADNVLFGHLVVRVVDILGINMYQSKLFVKYWHQTHVELVET